MMALDLSVKVELNEGFYDTVLIHKFEFDSQTKFQVGTQWHMSTVVCDWSPSTT